MTERLKALYQSVILKHNHTPVHFAKNESAAYVIKANEAILDENGEVKELHCTYDPDTLGKNPEGRKVRGVIHWVSAKHGKKATIRLYDRLFNVPNPGAKDNFLEALNPDSLEASLADAKPGEQFQFEREGYFTADRYEFSEDNLVFNRTVTLRDSWSDKEANS